MPIYEFYCPDCHIVMNFFSRSVNTKKRPLCPHCKKRRLERQVSLFAAVSSHEDGDDEFGGNLPLDESKLEKALDALSSEATSLDENDPRSAARLMRKFSDVAGMEFNEGIEEALRRMENGEDPEAIEAELGDALDSEDPFATAGGGKSHKANSGGGKSRGAPRRDKTLYDL